MIRRFRHHGLKRLYADGALRGVSAEPVEKVSRILAFLNRATRPADMNLPGFALHPRKGNLAEFWSVTVRANWRIVFRFEGADVTDVDLVDYH